MKLLFKQRLFSWFDSYDIFDETGAVRYTVKGQLAWGHLLKIFDAAGQYAGTVRQKIFALLPTFLLYGSDGRGGEVRIGRARKKLTFIGHKYSLDCNGWTVKGDVFGWDYTIADRRGKTVAVIGKELFRLTDTYTIEAAEKNILRALMVVLAIDAEKCSAR